MYNPNSDPGGSGGGDPYSNIGKAVRNTNRAVRRVSRPIARSSRHSSGGSSSGGGSSSRRSSGGGGGSSFSGGGGGGTSSAPAVPATPSINSYLGTDATYQQSLSGGKRTLKDYLADIGRRRGEATTQYNQTTSNMGQDRLQQLDDIRQEYASRGLINSGLFADAQGKFQKQYTDQLNSLGQQQTGLLSDLLSQQNNYQREYDLAVQQAKQEALARRAAKYGLTS